MLKASDGNGAIICYYNLNPLLNSGVYLAEFPDGHVQELGADAVIQAMYNNIDDDGHNTQIFEEII